MKLLIILYNGSLMVKDFPTVGRSAPNCRTACDATALNQRVCQQVIVGSNFKALKITSFPIVCGSAGYTLFQFIEYMFSAITATGCAHLPKRRIRHSFKVCSRRTKLRSMEDWFPLFQFSQNVHSFYVRQWIPLSLEVLHTELTRGAHSFNSQFEIRNPKFLAPPLASNELSGAAVRLIYAT